MYLRIFMTIITPDVFTGWGSFDLGEGLAEGQGRIWIRWGSISSSCFFWTYYQISSRIFTKCGCYQELTRKGHLQLKLCVYNLMFVFFDLTALSMLEVMRWRVNLLPPHERILIVNEMLLLCNLKRNRSSSRWLLKTHITPHDEANIGPGVL